MADQITPDQDAWKEFGNEYIDGVCWVCGHYPETDLDVDAYGKEYGRYTGENIRFVSLVYIEFDPDDPAAILIDNIQDLDLFFVDNESTITHYMPLEIPHHYLDMTEKKS